MNNSGIYIIKNIINNKFYLGSSVDLNKRFRTHKRELKLNKHHCIYLQRAWVKYKEENFQFIIIETCEKSELLNKEQFYINSLLPEYNTSKSSIAPMQDRTHSEQAISLFKWRKIRSGKDHYLFGTKWSDELREKIIKKRTGGKRSEETKEKQRQAALKRNASQSLTKSIELCKKKISDNHNNIFNSLTEAAKYWTISVSAVCDNLKGRSKMTSNGIIFKYEK